MKNIKPFLIALILNLGSIQSIWAAEADSIEIIKKEYLKKNSVDAQVAAYDALYALPENNITSRSDCFAKRIRGYIDIANEGITYIQHHYGDNQTILESNETLRAELMHKAEEGLTAVEFILFNMKLALLQEHYPDGYPLDFDESTKILLLDGSWKATPFYEYEMPQITKSGSFDTYSKPDLISQLKSRLSYLFWEGYEDFAFKPYIIFNPNGGFRTSRIIKNILRSDGKNCTLCALPIGAISVKNSPHGIYNRTPFAFLGHDLGHAESVWYKLSKEPQQDCPILNVQNFIKFIQPIINGINENRISDPIIDNFLFLTFYEDVYTQPVWNVDSSSLQAIFTSLENKFNAEKLKSITIDYVSGNDPFIDILNTYGREAGYYFLRDYSKGVPNIASPFASHYTGIRNIQLNDKTASFSCTARRTGEISEISPWHEYAEIADISLIDDDSNRSTLNPRVIGQILSLNGKRYIVPTIEGLTSSTLGVRKGMLQALGKSTVISFATDRVEESYNELALELLYAFKAKVKEIMPETLTA